MSALSVSAPAAPPPPAPAPVPPAPEDRRLRLVRRVAVVAFSVQLVAMGAWSAVLYSRYSVTFDGATYLQALHLISHGHLDPYSTTLRLPFWRGHFEILLWPLSVLDWLPPHGLVLFWAQDAAVVATEVVAFAWICRVARGQVPRPDAAWWPAALAGLGLVVLVADPWTYWATSFDFHTEPFCGLFVLAAAYDFSGRRNRRAWVWVGLTLLCGDVAGTWVTGLGLSALVAALVERDRRRALLGTGGALVVAGAAWLALLTAVGANKGSVLTASYGYLATRPGAAPPTGLTASALARQVLTHPLRPLRAFADNLHNLAANLAPAGLVGTLTPWTFGVPLVILVENELNGGYGSRRFSIPSFQSSPIYSFCAVGLVIVVAWVVGRVGLGRRALAVLAAVLAANALVWAVVWIPPVKAAWLRIPGNEASVLASVGRRIGPGDEVVASQGVVGRFAERRADYAFVAGPLEVPVSGRHVWFVLLTASGIESAPVDQTLAAVAELAGPLHATEVAATDGVFAFRWDRPASVHRLRFPGAGVTVPAWSAPGVAGRPVVAGPEADWYVTSTGRPGYLVSGDEWLRAPGSYLAGVSLSAQTPLNVEVWDDNDDQLVARRQVPATDGVTEVEMPFSVVGHPASAGYSGWGPLRIQPIPPLAGEELEVRVWAPAGAAATVYSVTLLPH
ncbi:MAG TPA: DUF2079 domain-containing protein [Acidimicrobiales bacterium]|nr:DUF2079 domain-containing protein [Acidimicrobiales bacterium]